MPNIQFGGTPVNPPSDQSYWPDPLQSRATNWEITDSVSRIAGNHHIKPESTSATSPAQHQWSQWNGVFNFGVNANNPNNTGHAYAQCPVRQFSTRYTESTKGVNFHNKACGRTSSLWQDNWRVSRPG